MLKPSNEVIAEINALKGMKTAEMHRHYDEKYPDLKNCAQCKILRAEISYRLQTQFYGIELPMETARLLDDIACDAAHLRENGCPPKAGARLIRNWKGKDYEVIIRDDGRYEYSGELYRSLSGVAHKITGTNWNGKLFFGLK